MSELEPKEPDEYCNARKTDGSGYCKHESGWGTDHFGHGRCRYHGGNTQNQEKNLIDKLSDAAGDAAIAYKLRLKHVRQKVEAGEGEDIDWSEFDRLGRTVLDRTGYGKTETKEVTGNDGGALEVVINDSLVEDDE